MATTVRTAASHDIPEIIPIVNAAFAVETFLDGTRTDELRMAEMMNRGTFLVAEDDGPVIASVYVELRGERAYFGMLAVDPNHQGKGLARTMIEAAEDYSRRHGCRAMDITVLSLRPELPPFYRKFGYHEVRTEEFRPSRPLKGNVECHGIVMSKDLS
jgi:predicted N-acetyltransferase YhbS